MSYIDNMRAQAIGLLSVATLVPSIVGVAVPRGKPANCPISVNYCACPLKDEETEEKNRG